MANETTTTSVNDLLPSIIAEAMFQAHEQSIMRNLVKNYTLPMGNGKTVTVPIYDAVAAAAVAEGTDLANTSVSTSSAVLTVSEAGIMTTVTDLAARTSAANIITDVGRLFGEAIAKKMDQDLLGLMNSLNGGAPIGDGIVDLSAAHIFEAVATLRNRGLSTEGMAVVVNPLDAYNLKSTMTNTFADPSGIVGNEALRSGFVGRIAGVPVFESSNVVAGDGGVFHRDALGLALMADISIEAQRDASLRGTELVATAVYGVGELRDTYGIAFNVSGAI